MAPLFSIYINVVIRKAHQATQVLSLWPVGLRHISMNCLYGSKLLFLLVLRIFGLFYLKEFGILGFLTEINLRLIGSVIIIRD